MGFLEVIRTLVISFQPPRYKELSKERSGKVFKHLAILIIAVFLFSTLLTVPKFLLLQSNLESEFGKIEKIEIKGDLKTNGPVFLTGDIVLDTSETRKVITDEKVLITKENLYFNFWAPMKIKVENILKPMSRKNEFASTIALLVLFLMPSVILFFLGLFFVKYILITLITGLLVFVFLRMLLLMRIRMRNVFNVCFLAAVPPVLLDGVVSSFFPKLLVPLFGVFTFKLNLIPLLVYIGLVVAGMIFVERELKFKKIEKDGEKGEEKLEWGF